MKAVDTVAAAAALLVVGIAVAIVLMSLPRISLLVPSYTRLVAPIPEEAEYGVRRIT